MCVCVCVRVKKASVHSLRGCLSCCFGNMVKVDDSRQPLDSGGEERKE